MDRKETVCAVLVTYNRKGLLSECLEALFEQTRCLDAIYLIDNASSDGTAEFLTNKGYIDAVRGVLSVPAESEKLLGPIKIHYVRMPENTGGAGGFYEGIKRGYEKGYDWLWIMDDDVYPAKDTLEILLEYKSMPGVLVPVEVLKNTLAVIDTSAIIYDLTNPFRHNPKLSVYEKYSTLDELPDLLDLEDFTFEGPLIKRDIVMKNGFPRSDFFISGDDTEYALRVKRAGNRLILIKKALLFKRSMAVPFEDITWKYYYYKRNIFWIHKRYGRNILVKYFKPFASFLAVALIKGILRGDMRKVAAAFYAVFDAFTDNLVNRYRP